MYKKATAQICFYLLFALVAPTFANQASSITPQNSKTNIKLPEVSSFIYCGKEIKNFNINDQSCVIKLVALMDAIYEIASHLDIKIEGLTSIKNYMVERNIRELTVNQAFGKYVHLFGFDKIVNFTVESSTIVLQYWDRSQLHQAELVSIRTDLLELTDVSSSFSILSFLDALKKAGLHVNFQGETGIDFMISVTYQPEDGQDQIVAKRSLR